jgi:N-acetylmuramoyl-L-alanine amidase
MWNRRSSRVVRLCNVRAFIRLSTACVIASCTSARTPPRPAPTAPAAVTPTQVAPPVAVAPTPAQANAPAGPKPLPPIPLLEGPLTPNVVYPDPNQAISVRDSNFIFGSVGNGRATLTINGADVPVAPNGAFLAFLPVPPATSPQYELVARTATDSASLVVPVRVPAPRPDLTLTGPLIVDSATVSPRTLSLTLRDAEPVRVSVRAAPNATAWVAFNGSTQSLVNVGGTTFATDVAAKNMRVPARLIIARGGDTARFMLAKVAAADTGAPRWVQLGSLAAAADTDATVIGRSTPAGTYKWMLIPGTIAEETGRSGDNVRVRVDSRLEIWVDAVNVKQLGPGYPVPRRMVGAMAFEPATEWVDLVMPVNAPPPFLVEQNVNRLTLTLYGTQSSPDIIKFLGNDSLVRSINWVPEASDRQRMTLELTRAPYGYLVLWDPVRGMILRLRRPPRIDREHPLRGLTITVDPGHPPGGATGPTMLTEAQGALWVAERLKRLLEDRGARVVITRTTMDPVDLHLRSVIARRENSHALISIHLNAFGDGVNPFPNVGTSTLFFHPQTEPMARLVQAGMMREMGLRDLGVHYQNIAIGRTTWMPALICEGAFLMVPEQENALRTEEFQERYARGVADGVEAYFRTLADR